MTFAISCSGVGAAMPADGVFVSGEVRLSDGQQLTVQRPAALR